MRHYRNVQQGRINIGSFSTSKREINDLVKSWIAISLAVSIIGLDAFIPGIKLNFIQVLFFSAITVGSAFILHEIGHKIAAQHYGCFAEFRSQDTMLILAIMMSFLGFVFFAPGAVMIAGPVGKKRNGIISASGPGTNFAIAILFLIGLLYVKSGILMHLFIFGYLINTWIGLFNMLPFWVFDGKKILRWNSIVYYGMLVIGFTLLFSKDLILSI